jgi:hypothetical protein
MSKMFIAGVNLQSGVGSKSGQPYSMPRVLTLETFSPFDSANLKRVGFGFVTGELACTPEVIDQANGLQFPSYYEVTIETLLRAGEYQPVVTAIHKPK